MGKRGGMDGAWRVEGFTRNPPTLTGLRLQYTVMLEREEYIEQTYFFRTLRERMRQNMSTQDLLVSLREEVLSTTNLPMAIDFLGTELRHSGVFATAMVPAWALFHAVSRPTSFHKQRTNAAIRFGVALEILELEADYRSKNPCRQGMFLYQFEALCRNRLGYDKGLEAVARDPIYDQDWRDWILMVRRQVGLVDFADLIYLAASIMFAIGIARDFPSRKDLSLCCSAKRMARSHWRTVIKIRCLFAALERHLNYPTVPRPKPVDETKQILPNLLRRVDRLEARLKLLEEEGRGGIDLTKFYGPGKEPFQPPMGGANGE